MDEERIPEARRACVCEALRNAAKSDLTRVSIAGQTWVRHDAGSPEDLLMQAREAIADLHQRLDIYRAMIKKLEAEMIAML